MIDWNRYAFEEDSEYNGLYSRQDFPFSISEKEDYLNIMDGNLEYTFSENQIPATNRSLENLLKAFCLPLS